MKDRNLETLRREHKSKFKARNTSSVKNQRERGGADLEQTKALSKPIHKTKSRKLKVSQKSPFFRVVSAVALLGVVIGLLVLIGNWTNSHRKNEFISTESKYTSPDAKSLDWEQMDFINYTIEEDEDKNITVSDFVKRYGLAKSSEDMTMGQKDKLLSLTYTLAGGGFAFFQFWDFGSGLHLASVTYYTDKKEELSDEELSFLKELKSDPEKGMSDQGILEYLRPPKSYTKIGIKGYYSVTMVYKALDSTYYHLEFSEGKDGNLHLKNIQVSEQEVISPS